MTDNSSPCGGSANFWTKKDVKTVFNVSLGGISEENFDSVAVNPSIQQRLIPLGATSFWLPIYKVPQDYVLIIKDVNWYLTSLQAEQDLRVTLVRGKNDLILKSGKRDDTTGRTRPPFNEILLVIETRVFATPGLQLDSISSATGVGVPDNFNLNFERFHAIVFEDTVISWKIDNQSALYSHAFQASLYGWIFPAQGINKKDILSSIVIGDKTDGSK